MKALLFLFTFCCILNNHILCQTAKEIYRKPMKEVLSDISGRYNVNLRYDENLVRDLYSDFATWRYRSDVEQTLALVLFPLDLVYEKSGDNTFTITKFSYYQRPVEEGKRHLSQLLDSYPAKDLWESRKTELRKCILENLELSPLPRKTPLNPVKSALRKYDGYTVENFYIETIPGVYLCGSIYKPSKGKGPFPAVLCPYGHWLGPDTNLYGRYRPDMQYRCATLAKMGAVVASYDMFACGESRLQFRSELHRTGLAHTMQTLNSLRLIDYITSLQYVDGSRIGITGASGGGTQTLLATALDDRITVSVPVVMVSSFFFGGCACESGMPVHSCTMYGTNNAEIAAMASPRPMLIVSDGDDWTRLNPEIEFPYLQKVYSLYGKKEYVENVHLANEKHDYGISKRIAMYAFMAKHLGLDISKARDKNGNIDESKVTIEKYDKMLAFGRNGKMPGNALREPDQVWSLIRSLQ